MAEGDAPSTSSSGIFDTVHFAIVHGDGIDDTVADTVRTSLEARGGTHYPLSSTDLRRITHLIANTPDFPAYEDACDGFVHVVKPRWIEDSLHKGRLANPRQYRPDPRLFLADVVVAIADDIPSGDKDAIIGGLQAMGGQYSSIMTKLVTHVVALSMENNQCRMIVDKRLSCKPVLPHWFDHCLMLGKKIGTDPYTLPSPPILQAAGVADDLKDKAKYAENLSTLRSTMHVEFGSAPPTSPSKNRKELSVFRRKNIKLADDLDLEPHLQETLESLITKGDGEIVSDIDDADTLVCRYRFGMDFKEALDQGKDIGNLNWLYHLVNTNKWSAPTRRLLHFPMPKQGLSGFKDLQISVSNYTGEARVYLESLIKAAGGTFTKTMTQNNTHLITAHSMSEKVDAAREWNIATVNHLWLEESYAKCKGQALTNPKYTTFPSRTNLGEIIGQTQLDRRVLEDVYLQHRQVSAESAKSSSKPAKTPLRPSTDSANTPNVNGNGNNTPSSRGAKDRAINKLWQMAPDIEQFQKELKRRGGVVYGGRRVTDPDRVVPKATKRSAEEETGKEPQVDGSARSKRKKPSLPNAKVRFVVTGGQDFNWTDVRKPAALKAASMKELPDAPINNRFDALVAPRVLRTPNFLAAIAAGVPIVRPAWITDAIKKGEQLATTGYELKDPTGEREYDVDLAESLKRSRKHRQKGGLLRNMTVYCTENIRAGVPTVTDIVTRNGGACAVFRGSRDTSPAAGSGDVFLLTVQRDKALWDKFRAFAKEHGQVGRVVKQDWLLRVALVQDVSAWEDGLDIQSEAAE